MSFYSMLNIPESANTEEIMVAYRRQVGELVRNMRIAEQESSDVGALLIKSQQLREAKNILCDPQQRRSYDIFRKAMGQIIIFLKATLQNVVFRRAMGRTAR